MLDPHAPSSFEAADAATSVSTDLAKSVDAAWGDPHEWTSTGLHWGHLTAIRKRINRLVSGDEEIAPLDWFFREVGQVRALPLKRVLVLGCGAGAVERTIARRGWALDVVGVDLSARALDLARASAANEGLANVRYHQADMNQLPMGTPDFVPNHYDAVIGVSGVHHCENLEGLYACLVALTKEEGWLFLDEYVGPSRFQFSDAQARHINRLLTALPARFGIAANGLLKCNVMRPTPEAVAAVDPTESVRSAELIPALDGYFSITHLRGYRGAILHFLLGSVAQNFDPDRDPDAAFFLQAAMDAEDELQRAGTVEDEFAALIARPIKRR